MFQVGADSSIAMLLIKYTLPVLLAASVSLTALAFGNIKRDVPLDTRPTELKESVPKRVDGKYTQFEKDEWKPNTRVIEYEKEGIPGYQVLEYELRQDGTFMRSYGEGPEAQERSYDWVKISDFATSTP